MRKLSFVISFLVVAFSVYALPGVSSYIPDTSGEYVYYRDYSFNRESYIGFLYYDDGTYAARYYAPLNSEKELPVQEVGILFSIDPVADHIEMTGERFTTSLTPNDTEIVNYLHDMMYEFTSRRQKAGEISPKTVNEGKSFAERGCSINDDFMQFGGDVVVSYDFLVPIFNIKKIVTSKGKVFLEIATAGLLTSSADTSFEDFTGIPDVLIDSNEGKKISAKKESQTFILNRPNAVQQISLDSLWQASASNIWLLNADALCSINIVPLPMQDNEKFINILQRKLLLGTEGSYSVWNKFDASFESSKIAVTAYYYQNMSGAVTKDFKILTRLNDEEFGYLNMTVFDNCYRKNHAYFDTILKSYKISK